MFLSYALMVYLVAFLNLVLRIFINSKVATFLTIFFTVFGLALNIHEVAIRYVWEGSFQSATLFDFSILVSIAFALTFLALFYKYRKIVIGIFLIPFSIIFSGLSMIAPSAIHSDTIFSVWRYGHLPFVILGTTLFVVSFITSVMYMIQDANLRSKKFGVIYNIIPPLDTLYKINNSSMRFGFYIFTIGSILGFFWAIQLTRLNGIEWIDSVIITHYPLAIKIIFSIITWIYFAILLAIKAKYGLPPKQLALFTIIGFFSVILTYIGVGLSLLW